MSKSKSVLLTDLLTEEQIKEVERIVAQHGDDMFEASNHLRRYLEAFKAQLEEKGVIPGYLAYVIVYKQWLGGDNGDRSVAFST